MTKFLALCEEFNPENNTDPKWKLIDFLKDKGINVSLIKGTNKLYINTDDSTIVVDVNPADAEEEAENVQADYGDYDVNSEVEGLAGQEEKGLKGLAGKVFGSNTRDAKTAVKQRQGVSKQAVGVYNKKTQQLKNDLRNVK